MSLLTAWQFLVERGHDEPNPLQPTLHHPVPLAGKTVLVNGAAGGVGHFAVQIAKWKGARVIAVGSGKQQALLRDLGADEVIDYETTAAETVVRDVDLVIDAVGGPAAARFLPVIKRGGALFLVFPLGFAATGGGAKTGRHGLYDPGSLQRGATGRDRASARRRHDPRRDRKSIPARGSGKAHERAAQTGRRARSS